MSLQEKINNKTACIGVVGLGYVGLPIAVEFARKGFKTIGIDLSQKKVESLNQGENYILDIKEHEFQEAYNNGFRAESNYDRIGECDIIYICVPTPFSANKEPDISYITSAATSIQPHLRKGQLVILKSTTFPNTTEGYVMPILDKSGLKVGEDYFLAFSPERIDPGNKKWNTSNTPIVVGGVTDACTEAACLANLQIISQVHRVSSPKVAEMEKLLENIFRSVNIALVNELALLCDRMGGINMWEVVEAAATKPFGFMPFFPGPGIGGHCILIDPYYLAWQAREYDFQTKFITLAAETNENMPFYVRDMIWREIAKMPVTFENAKILVLGVAFKQDVDDIRHSPALRIIQLLKKEGAKNIQYCDPYVPEVHDEGIDMVASELTPELISLADLVIITTAHSDFDYEMIAANAKRIVDTRNATKHVKNYRDKISLLGDGKQ
ncbi:nucleotide sugar dehydrogenase [Chloroherpeton thalassium ATCC 35110]|uniref:Nucleotide sugar dehydrogenase n=1 Tax=Chloroherpeton thalassium (strain ATCC 35110 / GB-78) TaxID=517418 RepID=B3QTP9_CHLT3|nr:nucleotide sugar dehydrogenase [Chloroherpeton thalassium]ACF14247.1 nucleotide sugar dehydrogenase [Chloroherpeton thalassium ATCC 35110]